MSKLSKQLSRRWAKSMVAATALACAGGAWAQNAAGPAAQPMNVVQLSAEGSVDVVQDLLIATLSATREGKDASVVQSQLQKVVEAAMAVTKRNAQPGQMDVRTGSFGIYPRYGKDNKVDGWQGRAEIVLQGRDFARITQTAAQVQDMTLSGTGFELSREAREKVEGEAQAKAIEQFKQRAATLAKSFGFANYSLREVNVSSSDSTRPMPHPRMMAMAAKSGGAEMDAVPVEAGKAQVVVNVSGSVQMH
jgi:predicted secreted protein